MWNGSQSGSRFRTWGPRDPEGREKDAERKAKAKKKKKKYPKVKVTNFQVL